MDMDANEMISYVSYKVKFSFWFDFSDTKEFL